MDIYTFKNPRPQHFTLPYPIMKYILKNATPKAWKKLMKTCKYFFSKNPTFPIDLLQSMKAQEKWLANCGTININQLLSKLWLCGTLNATSSRLSSARITFLIPKLSHCSLQHLSIHGQNFTWNEYRFLTSSCSIESFSFSRSTVKYSDGKMVTFDKILENLKNIVTLQVYETHPLMFDRETAKNMIELLPNFKKIDYFLINSVTQKFDISAFTDFLLQHKTGQIFLNFHRSISDEYKQKIDKCYEKIIKNPPKNLYRFWYSGMNQTQFEEYEKLYERKRK